MSRKTAVWALFLFVPLSIYKSIVITNSWSNYNNDQTTNNEERIHARNNIRDKECIDRTDFLYRPDACNDWLVQQPDKDLICNHESWINEPIGTYWCPKSCQKCNHHNDLGETNTKSFVEKLSSEANNHKYSNSNKYTRSNNTIVYLEFGRFGKDNEKSLELAGLRGTDGNGGCGFCKIRGVTPRDVPNNTQWWESVGSFVMDVESVPQHHHLLDNIPSRVVKILYWREALYNEPKPEHSQKFDVIMGTHFFDAMLNPCHYPANFNRALPILNKIPFAKRSTAVFVTSNCGKERDQIILELQKHMDGLNVYGKCGDTNPAFGVRTSDAVLPPKNSSQKSRSMTEFYSNFRFYFAIENTFTEGYVSEKMFRGGLGSGAIPVYLGASKIHDFPKLDGKTNWFVNARDFATLKDLAMHLEDLSKNETRAREMYLHWQDYATSAANSNSNFSKTDATWMPNAPDNFKECFMTKNLYGVRETRKRYVCKLCHWDYLQEIKQRGLRLPKKVGLPTTWEIYRKNQRKLLPRNEK